MLIDFHTHAFPEAIACRAVPKLARDAGGLEPQTDGTIASLKQQMAVDGVDISVVHSIATNPRPQKKVNDFAMAINEDPAIVAFGSVHPDAPDALEESQLRDIVTFACTAAGLSTMRFGGLSSVPELADVYAAMK